MTTKNKAKLSINSIVNGMTIKQKKISIVFMMIVMLIMFLFFLFTQILKEKNVEVMEVEEVSVIEKFNETLHAVLSPIKKIDLDKVTLAWDLYTSNNELQRNEVVTDTLLMQEMLQKIYTYEKHNRPIIKDTLL